MFLQLLTVAFVVALVSAAHDDLFGDPDIPLVSDDLFGDPGIRGPEVQRSRAEIMAFIEDAIRNHDIVGPESHPSDFVESMEFDLSVEERNDEIATS